MNTMREVLEQFESDGDHGKLEEAVSAAFLDRVANGMLSSQKIESLMNRVFDADERGMFNGIMLEPLRALLAKAFDAMGLSVSGSVISKAGREMRSLVRGDMPTV